MHIIAYFNIKKTWQKTQIPLNIKLYFCKLMFYYSSYLHSNQIPNTFPSYTEVGSNELLEYIFREENGTFTSLLWATVLSLLYLNAIKVKNAYIYSKRAVYFSLSNERYPFANDSFFWMSCVYTHIT